MKSFITALCVVFFGQVLTAQNQIVFKDKTTKSIIPFVTVYFPESKTSVQANAEGVWLIKQKSSNKLIQVSAFGYASQLMVLDSALQLKDIYLTQVHQELQEVVLSGSGHQLQGEHTINVTTKKIDQFATSFSPNLTAQISTTPGVYNASTGPGIGKPVIRGLSGNRIVVYAQGIRVENQQWGGEHGLGLDDGGFESVEIIKGPASLLYGSDALGGVLYFVDERFQKQNSANAEINSGYNSNGNGLVNSGSFKLSKGNWHFNAFGGYKTFQDYSDGNNQHVENTRFNTSSFKSSLGFHGKKFNSIVRYSFLNENYGLIEAEDDHHDHEEEGDHEKNERTPLLPYQNIKTNILSLENTFYLNKSKLYFNVGYLQNNRKEFEEEHDHGDTLEKHHEDEAALNMRLHTLSYNLKWQLDTRKNWDFILGSQGMIKTNTNFGEEILIPNAQTTDFGVFATADYHYAKRSFLQFGARYDYRKITNQDLSQNAVTTYPAVNVSVGWLQYLAKHLNLRLNLATGFRAPNTSELYSDGSHHGALRYEVGNANLSSETNYQLDVSLNFTTEHVDFYVNPFYNYIQNYIGLNPNGTTQDELPVYVYGQSNAHLYGVETGLHIHPHPYNWLHIDLNYSNVYGQEENGDNLALMPAQEINADLRLDFNSKGLLNKSGLYFTNRYVFTQKALAQNETETPAYYLLGGGVYFSFKAGKQKLHLKMGIENALNKTYVNHLSTYKNLGVYNMGRTYSVALRIPFEFKI